MNWIRRVLATASVFGVAALCLAQQPAPKAPVTAPVANPTGIMPPAAPPGILSHDEQLELENISLNWRLLNMEYSELVQKILAEHPGYSWNPNTNSLIPPAPPAAPPPAK